MPWRGYRTPGEKKKKERPDGRKEKKGERVHLSPFFTPRGGKRKKRGGPEKAHRWHEEGEKGKGGKIRITYHVETSCWGGEKRKKGKFQNGKGKRG